VERAAALAAETLEVARARNDDWCISITQFTLARIAGDRGDTTEALAGFAESARRGWLFRDLRQAAWCIWASAILLARNHQPIPAVTLLGVATSLHELRGGLAFDDGPASAGRTLAELQAQLPAETFDAALRAGQGMTAEEAIAFVTTLQHPPPSSSPSSVASAPYGLTPREIEVLRLLTEGLTDREIADRLSISERTAGNHVQHAMQKIGVASRTAAAVFAVRHILD
jgi:non-specific serine/threonine protein kinase